MKTERMVLLVTPEEKARIGAEAAKLDVSASEYVRRLVALLDADDVRELENIVPLVPSFASAIENMEANIRATMATFEKAEEERAYRRTDEYRTKVLEELRADPSVDWDAATDLFGGGAGRTGLAA